MMTKAEQIEAAWAEYLIEMACTDGEEWTVCPGCCRMAPDCEPFVLTDTLWRYRSEVRCGECRAALLMQNLIRAGLDLLGTCEDGPRERVA
jgi:hypothetical protein